MCRPLLDASSSLLAPVRVSDLNNPVWCNDKIPPMVYLI
jgi:hypothetical protein